MRRIPLLVALALAVVALPARAQDDPLSEVTSTDPLELARAVSRMGDTAVLQQLGAEVDVGARLSAIRATPWLHAPEEALAPLADLARGRDPDLAPAAALSALTIARRLDADDLSAREVDGAILEAAIEAFRGIGDDEGCRRDIRRAGFLIADRLVSLRAQS